MPLRAKRNGHQLRRSDVCGRSCSCCPTQDVVFATRPESVNAMTDEARDALRRAMHGIVHDRKTAAAYAGVVEARELSDTVRAKRHAPRMSKAGTTELAKAPLNSSFMRAGRRIRT